MNRTELEQLSIEDLQEGYSDAFKSLYNFRPRGREETREELIEFWASFNDRFDAMQAEEKAQEQSAIQRFENRILEALSLGAPDRQAALRWLTQEETFHHSQDVEGFVYDLGVLFTDYGKELLKEIEAVVEYAPYDWGVE